MAKRPQVTAGRLLLDEGTRPEPVDPYRVRLHRQQDDLGGQPQPGQQHDHQREEPVHGAGPRDDPRHDQPAEKLQHLPPDGGQTGPRQQGAHRHVPHGQPEGQGEDPRVEEHGERDADEPRPGAKVDLADGEPCDHRAAEQAGADDEDQDEAAQDVPRKAAPPAVGNAPDRVRGVLHGRADAARPEQRAEQADHQSEAGLVQAVDVALQLVPDDRELGERGVEDLGLQRPVGLQDDAQHRHQDQQQREDREDGVVGAQCRELSGVVVPELLDHRYGEREQGLPALDRVGPAEQCRGRRWRGCVRQLGHRSCCGRGQLGSARGCGGRVVGCGLDPPASFRRGRAVGRGRCRRGGAPGRACRLPRSSAASPQPCTHGRCRAGLPSRRAATVW